MNSSSLLLDVRTVNFSKAVLEFCRTETPTIVNRSLISQLIRSATSIGANYAEANNAASKSDFKNKIFIAKKEAAETKYWLTLMADVAEDKDRCTKLTEECHYLLMTFQKIINTLNQSKQKTVNAQ